MLRRACSTSPAPHICLLENHWDDDLETATQRYYIVDALNGTTARYALSISAYRDEALDALLQAAGFGQISFYPSLVGHPVEEPSQADCIVVTGSKPT